MEPRKRRQHKRERYLSKGLAIVFFMSSAIFLSSFTPGAFGRLSPSELIVHEEVVQETFEPQMLVARLTYAEAPVIIPPENDICEELPEEPTPATPKPWTEEEVIVLAKMTWGEAGIVPSKMEQAACVWCVLNRCDAYNQGIIEVTTAPYQFLGYNPNHPVKEDLYELCEDVLSRWYAEKNGETDVGRVLPPDYLYFHGDGKHNYFRNAYKGGTRWDWSYPNPYEN